MTEQHVPVDDLAAYAAGDLDATAAVAVEAHLVLCADCSSDVDAVTRATAALAAVEPVAMPAEVARRIDGALAAERAAPGAGGPVGTVLPMKRRRPSFAGIATVAAGIALAGAISVPLLRGGSGRDTATTADAPAARDNAESGLRTATRRLDSGLLYTHDTLATTLARAANGDRVPQPAAGAGAPAGPKSAASATPTGEAALKSLNGVTTTSDELAVEVDNGRLAACIDALGAGLPADARVPVLVDFARYGSKPAVVVAFATVSHGTVRTDSIDVWIAGPGCGTVAGGDVLDFARIARPQGV